MRGDPNRQGVGVAEDLMRGLSGTSSTSLGELPKTSDVAAEAVWEKGNADSNSEAKGVSFSGGKLVEATSDSWGRVVSANGQNGSESDSAD